MDISEIEGKVRTFILESYLTEGDTQTFRNDEDLLLRLDSLQILRMVIAFEGTFRIKVADGDLTPENLGSVQRLAALIVRKQEGQRTVQGTPHAIKG